VGLPENVIGEIIGGDLVLSPRPTPRHGVASSALGSTLGPPFQFGDGGPGGWWIIDEPELHLGEDILVPDLAGWHRERLPAMPEQAYFTLAPDWICEILSPSTTRIDRTRKMPIYARAGIPHPWLLDPIAETLEVYSLAEGRWLLLATHGGDESVRVSPFEAVEVKLGRVWGRG